LKLHKRNEYSTENTAMAAKKKSSKQTKKAATNSSKLSSQHVITHFHTVTSSTTQGSNVTGVDPPVASADIVKATNSYETWLSKQTAVVAADLERKHQQMAVSPFIHLRATFYRFAEQWPQLSGAAGDAPIVVAVGDLHIENFGTWRDSEGRLVWGVNDFDETCCAPFTVDLVRLAVSAILAIEQNHLSITPAAACEAILSGYKESIKAGGRAFVLAEDHGWLRDIAVASLKKPSEYWRKLTALPKQIADAPVSAIECLERLMPERDLKYELVHRVAGEGSLGRPRYTGIASWHGGFVARDVKAMLPSAWQWAGSHQGPYEILYTVAVGRAVRCQDPIVHSNGQWIGRRIAPDCSRIELISLNPESDEANLLSSMGWETANIHLGTPAAAEQIKAFLKSGPPNWLESAAEKYVAAIKRDWEDWKAHITTASNGEHS
jgi:hypothetical protein